MAFITKSSGVNLTFDRTEYEGRLGQLSLLIRITIEDIGQYGVLNLNQDESATQTKRDRRRVVARQRDEGQYAMMPHKVPLQEQCDSSDDDDDLASVSSSRSNEYARSLNSLAIGGVSGYHNAVEALTSPFLDDVEISNLLNIALSRKNAQAKFVSEFFILLVIYGRELRQEAVDGKQEAAAKFIQAKTINVAAKIQKIWTEESNHDHQIGRHGKDAEQRKAAQRVGLKHFLTSTNEDEDDCQSGSSSAEDEPDIIADAPHVPSKALVRFMTSCRAFEHLRIAFWRMVFPHPLRGIRDVISNAFKSSSGACTATLNIHWPIQAYIATELGYDSSLKHKNRVLNSVLTVTGHASRAYANTADAYVKWKWPEAKVNVLDEIGNMLEARSRGKLTQDSQKTD